jgi:protein TonB
MRFKLWQTGLPRPERRVRLAVAGVTGAFVVLFAASIALSYVLNRAPAPPATNETVVAAPEPPAAPASTPASVAAPASPATMDEWKAALVTLLQRNKQSPPGTRCASGLVRLEFRLDREGQIVASEIQSSSGYGAFDAEALDLLARIGRFPPPPDPTQDVYNFTVPIRFEAATEGCGLH